MNYESIGTRVKYQREALGLTLAEVGMRVGTSASVVLRWENGDIASLKTTKLEAIAKALDTSIEYLLGIEKVYVPSVDLARNIPITGAGSAILKTFPKNI